MIISEIQSEIGHCLVTAQNSKHPQILATTPYCILTLSLRYFPVVSSNVPFLRVLKGSMLQEHI